MTARELSRRLAVYVVTSSTAAPPARSHLDVVGAAIAGGATAVQLRAPELTDDDLLPVAVEAAERCRHAGVLFVVNDRVDVAVTARADGVHLGQEDNIAGAAGRLLPGQVLGVSVSGPQDVAPALRAGADYLGATVWATTTKPEALPGGVEVLRAITAASPVPVVGIGGITVANAGAVIAAGAAGVAVVSAVAGAPDPVAATRELVRAVATAGCRTRSLGPQADAGPPARTAQEQR